MIDEKLLEYATEAEARYLMAVNKYGSNQKAAKALGLSRRTVDKALVRLRTRAARQGYSPEQQLTRTAAPGFVLKGHSDFINEEDGTLSRRWLKYDADKEKQWEMMKATFEAMAEELPRVKPTKGPENVSSELINQYTLTDYHLGCLAWGEETGADWDLKIAEDLLIRWFEQAIKLSPDTETAIFSQLGDHAHYDGILSVTPTSGHILDADSRYQKIIRVLIRTTRRIIKMLLKKHKRVIVLMAEGNHDISVSMASREWLHAMYEDEPRLMVDRNPRPYYCYLHGQTMLTYHHGHLKKIDQLPSVMAALYPKEWGAAKHRFCHSGHLHHDKVIEFNGMKHEQHRTLASPDAHAARGGYVSERSAKVITYHKVHGEVSRITITPDMVYEAGEAA